MLYLRIGFRNLIKNFRRSFITMIPIIIGMVACLLAKGFFNWHLITQREAAIRNGLGHYQLIKRGFLKSGSEDPYGYLIQDPAPVLKALREIPQIQLATARIPFNGILSSEEQSTIVVGEAGDPAVEMKLNSYSGLTDGTGLHSEMPYSLIIGDGVAKKLGARLGDTLTLMGYMKDGGINAVDLKLTGIRHSGVLELDRTGATVPLEAVQGLLNVDQGVQRLVVLLNDTKDMNRVLPQIQKIAAKYELECQSWEARAEFYSSLKLMFDTIFFVIIFLILFIAVFTISNTVNMNLNDRIREIGTIRALGCRRIQVAFIFLAESWLMGVIGGVAGLLVSFLVIGVTELIGGIPVLLRGDGGEMLVRIFFRPDWNVIILCLVLFSMTAVIASLFPSRRAASLSITEALRWI